MKENARTLFNSCVEALSRDNDDNEARTLSLWLMEELLGLSSSAILAGVEVELDDEKSNQFDAAIQRLVHYEPIQHILGHTYFFGRKFMVNQHVLIPRQETEEMVDVILKRVGKLPMQALDIGTGSGIIAITLKLELPTIEITGWDVSSEAIQVAKKNADLLGVDQIVFEPVNVFEVPNTGSWDLVVSNPPYVLESERQTLPENVRLFDPEVALFVPDADPLKFYRRIGQYAASALRSNGWLFFEIHEKFGKEIVDLLTIEGFERIEILQDINGKDRMIVARQAAL